MFVDSVRLKDGLNFRDGFIDAIAVSRVIVPIMSSYALERMRTLTETSDVDNLLVEWYLALILQGLNSATVRVFPIMLGPLAPATTVMSVEPTRQGFPAGVIQQLPEVLPVKTLAAVRDALCRLGLPASAAIEITVREVVSRLSLFQAYRPKDVSHAAIIATACDQKVLRIKC